MRFIAPQLATLVDEVPRGDEWIHEQKFDGYRVMAMRDRGGPVRLYTRSGKDWTTYFPTVAEALARLDSERFAIDGEVAVATSDGGTDFQALQQALGTRDPRLKLFAFDLLIEGDEDLRARRLVERKARLDTLIATSGSPVVVGSTHVAGKGDALFAAACARGMEGIVSKRASAPYTSGRGTAWVKTKCRRRQELVVGGYTEGQGGRAALGALLVGVYDEGGALRYAGKVGTGFTARTLDELGALLRPLARDASPFVPVPARAHTGPRPRWVEPKIVVEVAFGEWTRDGRLRHPSFQGVRLDKPARDVRREGVTAR